MIALLLSLQSFAAPAEIGGYFRVMTRPDLQGGAGRLGYWNLYGRLLNEGPYATLDFRFRLLDRTTSQEPWTSLHTRIEGASIREPFQNSCIFFWNEDLRWAFPCNASCHRP